MSQPIVLETSPSRPVERALRHAVSWRKISFGNKSAAGEVATGRLLTLAQTCVMQQHNALDFLADSISRHRAAQPSLSLLKR